MRSTAVCGACARDAGEDLLLERRVHRAERVVEHEHARRAHQRARQRDPLALPAGEGEAAVAEHAVEAAVEPGDDVVGRGRGDRGMQRGGVALAAEEEVLGEGVGEEERLLADDADRLLQVRGVELGEVDTVDEHVATIGLGEAARERGHGRLPRARGPGDRHDLAGRRVHAQAVEHEPAVEQHVDVVERDAGGLAGRGERDGGRAVRRDDRDAAHLEHLPQAVLRAAEVLPRADDAVEPCTQLSGEGRELERDEERAERDVVGRHQPRPHVQQQRLREHRQRLEREVEPGEQPCTRHRVPVDAHRDRRDLRPLVLLAAERLHDADAADRLVDRGGHLGAFVELGPRERGELGADHAQQLDGDRQRQQRDDRERGAQDEEVHADAEERGAERERDRQQAHDRLHDLEVGERTGDELAAGDRVEVADLGGLDRVVEVGAQVVLELVGDAGECLAQREHEEAGEDREPDDPPEVIGERDGLADDALVDHRAGEADDGDVRDPADGQHDEQEEQEPLLALEVLPRERVADDAPSMACAAHRMCPPSCHSAAHPSRRRRLQLHVAGVSRTGR